MDIQTATIDELNRQLEADLYGFKKETDFQKIRESASRLNSMLYSTIDCRASDVNAVQVEANVNVSLQDVWRLKDYGYRGSLTQYLEMNKVESDPHGIAPFRFTLHLPFSFTTGTHGSGERDAMAMSYENIRFESPQDADHPQTLMLNIGAVRGFFGRISARLLPEEVASLKLAEVEDSEFSTRLDAQANVLKPSQTALHHYLDFRGVERSEIYLTKKGSKEKQYIYAFESDQDRIKEGNKRTITGFVVLKTKDAKDEFELYEFDDVEISDRESHNFEYLAATAIVQHINEPEGSSGIKTYTGHDIIARLAKARKNKRF